MKNNPAISIASRGLHRTIASVLLALWLSPATLSVGQDSEPEKSQAQASEKAGKKEEPSAGAKKAEQAKAKKDILAIVGADIVTVTQETIRRGTILIEDGKFSKVGTNVEVPAGATIIDAEGKVVAPGFVAINASRVGLRTSSDRSAKYADGLDPFDRNVSLSLGVGITTACLQVRTGGGGFRR